MASQVASEERTLKKWIRVETASLGVRRNENEEDFHVPYRRVDLHRGMDQFGK